MGRDRLPLLTGALPLLAGAVVFWSLLRLSTLVPLPVSAVLLFMWGGALLMTRSLAAPSWTVLSVALWAAARGDWPGAAAALFLGLTLRDSQNIVPVELAMVASTATLGVWGIVFSLGAPTSGSTAAMRFVGPIGDPNDLAQVAILGLLPVLVRIHRTHGRWRAASLLVLAIGTWAVLASHSRAGMVLLALLLVMFASRWWRSDRKLAVASLLMLIGGLALVPPRYWWRLFRLLDGQDLGLRPQIMGAGWDMFLQSPWFGVGAGNFEAFARGLAPHNILLEVLAEGGLLLFIPTLALLVLVFRAAWLGRHRAPALALLAPVATLLALTGPMDGRVLIICLALTATAAPPPTRRV